MHEEKYLKVSDEVSKSIKFQGFNEEELSSIMDLSYNCGEKVKVCEGSVIGLQKFEVENSQLNESSQNYLDLKEVVQLENVDVEKFELLKVFHQEERKRNSEKLEGMLEEVSEEYSQNFQNLMKP